MTSQITSLAISLLLSLGLGYPAMLLAQRFGLMDVPGAAPHKVHARPTPLAGGLLAVFTLVLLAVFFPQWLSREIVSAFFGALVVFFFGLWDDRKGLSALPKLAGQLIAAGILIAAEVRVNFLILLSNAGSISPEFAQVLNMVITLFWLVGITNAMNMIDSMDGIVAGLGVIAFAFFWGAAILADQPVLAYWSAVLMGISMGLYFWNAVSAKFFLGDSGTQTLGFLLASFGMMYNPLERSPESSWIVPIMLLGVPIFDTTLVVLSRLRRRQMVGTGRRDHTYHRFIALGLAPRIAVLAVHLMALILSIIAYLSLYIPPMPALIFFMLSIIIGLTFLLWLERKPTLDENRDETS